MKPLPGLALLLAVGALTVGIRRSLAARATGDEPWASVARDAREAEATGQPVLRVIRSKLPGLYTKMLEDAKRKDWLALWGQSINYDEYAKGVVVQPALIREFEKLFGIGPMASDRIVHAGVEHTYGYLFSDLKTPFGFKRARWVKPTLNEGFALAGGPISPVPHQGTLLSNVTYFIGRIAFRGEPKRLGTLESRRGEVARALVGFPYDSLRVSRLEETVDVPLPTQPGKSRVVRLRTDFVPFRASPTGESDSHLLVYSIDDPADGGSKLITAFPVERSFVERASAPGSLGRGKPVMTRYNGYVAGLSGQSIAGDRELHEAK